VLKGQKAWLVYRDAQCDLADFVSRGGSLEPMVVAGCKAELTIERIKTLQALISVE
jgi:uncharacterized protein YecT (DUF1311 family)